MRNVRFKALTVRKTVFLWPLLVCLFLAPQVGVAVDLSKYPAASELITELSETYGLDEAWVEAIVRDAAYSQSIIDAITRPAEKFPWHRYRKIFVTAKNADQGVVFWNRNSETLQRVQQTFGVDPAIVVAIIGVETRFGKITGRHRVIDSLVTLTLGYPRRAEFFKKELAEFIRLAEEENLNPFEIRGSYAGAMGIPQFISSSYRHYAIDFNNNQRRDLLTETVDAIGSVGNYLSEHGWQRGGQVFSPAVPKDSETIDLTPTSGLKTDRTIGDVANSLSLAGGSGYIAQDQQIGLVKLETKENEFVYRVAFPNFYVITTYNRSTLYAMAVAELAELISTRRTKN